MNIGILKTQIKMQKLVTTQRDYLAGITSTDITRRFFYQKDIEST